MNKMSSANKPCSSSGGGGGGPCGACKYLRRKCVNGCIFAPYFDSDQGPANFAAVHKVFGASNVSKLLLQLPAHKRLDAVVTICYEAQARVRDPVYGCVAHIFALQQQVLSLQTELSYLQAHLTTVEVPRPPRARSQPALPPQQYSLSDLPLPSSTMPATHDLSSLFDSMVQPSWTMQQQPPPPPHNAMDMSQFRSIINTGVTGPTHGPSSSRGHGDSPVARELLHVHESLPTRQMHGPSPSSCMSI
ncbi:LOB domain-containing protein 30-like [Silene latifolia]|uniref:LOB domain-containing protein 30-like n=1 Tax=Silene latifolia TaxID=37657 RepID=UPI003D77653D